MLEKIDENSVSLDGNIVVNVHSLWSIKFSKGNHSAFIRTEWCTAANGDSFVCIYVNTLECWAPPHEREIMTGPQKSEIIEKILLALDFLKFKYELDRNK